MRIPVVNGLLNYHIKGDEALLHLGRDRYERAGMGVEIHPASPEHLRGILKFIPPESASTAHLPYSVKLDHDATALIRDFVLAGGDAVKGYILHDTMFYQENLEEGLKYICKLDEILKGRTEAVVFLEYAVGLPFPLFLKLAECGCGVGTYRYLCGYRSYWYKCNKHCVFQGKPRCKCKRHKTGEWTDA